MSLASIPSATTMRVTPRRIVHSEWTKTRTVRSTIWTLVAAAVFVLAVGIVVCAVFEARWPHLGLQDKLSFRPLRANLAGVNIAQLAFGVFGVMSITGEYSTGMIRSTMAAVPTRLPVLWSKALVVGVTTFAVSVPAVVVVFVVGQGILSGQHIEISLSHPGVIRALLGACLYMTVFALFGFALGAIVRRTAAGISLLVAIMFVIPPLFDILPSSITDASAKFLPSNAGGVVWTIDPDAHMLGPWAGFGLFCAWTALALAIAAVLMVRRDV